MSPTLSLEELDRHEVSLVEPRETLAFFNWSNVTAQNLALALNTVTYNSTANAWAGQAIFVVQG